MKKEFYNPVFESLLNTVKEYKPVYRNTINEDSNEAFKDIDQAFKYYQMIFDSWMGAIILFANSCLIVSVKDELSKFVMEEIVKINKNSTLEEIIKNLNVCSDKISSMIKEQKKSETLKVVYNNFSEGVELLNQAYGAYKKRAEINAMLTNPDLLLKINNYIQDYVKQIQKVAEDNKKRS